MYYGVTSTGNRLYLPFSEWMISANINERNKIYLLEPSLTNNTNVNK